MHRAFSAAPKSTFCTIEHYIRRQRRAPLNAFFSKRNVARRQNIVSTRANKLRLRIQEFSCNDTESGLGDALAAAATDIATEYIFRQSYDDIDRVDFNTGITNMVRGHGDIERRTKHIPFLGPIMIFSTGDSEQPLLGRLERLPYLTALIKEGLRMSLRIATRMTRIAAGRDITYGSWSIPAGTPVGMAGLLMHYDEQQYPNPTKFEPDRWLRSDSNKAGEKVFAPFSKETKMCVGMHLAWAELYIIIATLLVAFDIEFIDAEAEDIKTN
ncbi:MAG: hypothetical protein M1820_000086 [Bogoriella megaspora]|nr:MAG: hypothetical protein M1820_000086 [Bogoriella megaspora]